MATLATPQLSGRGLALSKQLNMGGGNVLAAKGLNTLGAPGCSAPMGCDVGKPAPFCRGGEAAGQFAKADEAKMAEQKAALIADLNELTTEFERFKQCQPPDAAQGSNEERLARIDFFLSYVARVVTDVQQADAAKLAELEMQIRLYLHPLKAKIMCQFPGHVTAAPQPQPGAPQAAEVPVKQELVLEAAVPAGGVPWQASSLSEEALSTTTAPSEQSDDGLDELDFECFERALLDDTQPPREPEEGPSIMTRNTSVCASEDDGTDTGSMISMDDTPSTPVARGVKRSSQEITAPIPPVDEAPALARVEEVEAGPQLKKPAGFSAFTRTQPRGVEYTCVSCNESYPGSCLLNPWWSLEVQDCPKCAKPQVPRIDITLPANAMDYHPALLAEEGDDDSDDEGALLDLDGMEEDGEDPYDQGDCPLTPEQSSKLLVLLAHGRTCPGLHRNPAHAQVCLASKFMMLHVRDCDGKTLDGEPCGFSWCRPCKLLLGHLVRCYEPEKCGICTPRDLPKPFEELKTLNWLREQLVHQQQQPQPQQHQGGVEVGGPMASAAGGPAHVHVEGVCPQAHDICAMDDAPGFGEELGHTASSAFCLEDGFMAVAGGHELC